MVTFQKSTHWRILILVLLLLASSVSRGGEGGDLAGFESPIRLRHQKGRSSLEIWVDEGVPVELKNNNRGFELFLRGITLSDLGVLDGAQARWSAGLSRLSDSRMGHLKAQETPEGVKISGIWKYPKGNYTLARPQMISFDYRETDPPRYVLDFWVKSGKTLSAELETQRHARWVAKAARDQQIEKARVSREVAALELHAKTEDPDQFCRQTINENNEVFLEFYPVHQEVNFKRWFPSTSADANFVYTRPERPAQEERDPKHLKEETYVRTALNLYEKAKLALVIRSLKFYEQAYPHPSPRFQGEMKFLRANSLMKLGFHQEAEDILKKLMTDEPGSRVALQAALYLTGKFLENKASKPALDNFLWLMKYYSKDPLNWVFHLGAAECFYSLRQTGEASKEYRWVMDNGPDLSAKAEAAFRIGDLYLIRFQYEQALAVDYHSLKNFESQKNQFPAFHINRGEIYYQLGQYQKARKVFEEFLQNYGAHPSGWRAAYRLGEIYARGAENAADASQVDKNRLLTPDEIRQSRDWFYQSINHYPFTPGVVLGRIRLMPCEDHGGATLDFAKKFMNQEAEQFDGSSEVLMKNYKDMKALAYIRTLSALGTPDETARKAIEELKDELRRTRSPAVRSILTMMARGHFRKAILELLDQGKKFDALTLYSSIYPTLPFSDSEEMVQRDYLLKLSQVASELGLGKLAMELNTKYRSEGAQKGPTQKGPNRGPSSVAESPEDFTLQLAQSEERFTQAKALWLSWREEKGPNRSSDTLVQIRNLLSDMRDESRSSYQKEIILGLIDEVEKKAVSALRHAVRAQVLRRNAGMGSSSRLDAWLASLETQSGDPLVALNLYRQLEKTRAESKPGDDSLTESILGLPPAPSLSMTVLSEGKILENLERWQEAADVYSQGIEKGYGGSQLNYQYARALLKTSTPTSRQKAYQVLEKLASPPTSSQPQASEETPDPFWKKLAKETLEDEKTRDSLVNRAKDE